MLYLDEELIAIGTWQAKPGEVRDAVSHALKTGYRHLDCALIYQNENEVGQGIKDSGVPRKDIFITSKVWNTHQPEVANGLEQTLKSLGTDYLDLYVSFYMRSTLIFQLIHWPVRLVPVGQMVKDGTDFRTIVPPCCL
jgi:glycerol 2-dehydrogenase (NADP+)